MESQETKSFNQENETRSQAKLNTSKHIQNTNINTKNSNLKDQEKQKKKSPLDFDLKDLINYFRKKQNKAPSKISTFKFFLDKNPRLINLDNIPKQRSLVDIRYPLIPPFSYVHIYWNDEVEELIYAVEEPKLDQREKKILAFVKDSMEEMVNISFTKMQKQGKLVAYLEDSMKTILIEKGLEITEKTYQKLMYYLYRDSLGFNAIEPLLADYYIEDIECNGLNYPLYIVHRKFENIRTNIIFKDSQELINLVEKLAQKSGRYVSYAKPLLDGTLPDGSRVNATYTEDVTTRGPTFTVRKFTQDPWTPVHMVNFKTAPAELFAYLWIAIENKMNVMVVGETASGKTTFLNSILHFVPPESRICSIEDTREINISHDNWLPAVTRIGFGIPNLLGKTYGEITLFDLLKETFRQNPDYVIVGEVRGKETYVLFQGMASGHPSFSTFHAGSVETLVRRLETPPINLSATLIESLDIVCIASHIKESSKNMRRVNSVHEIIEVEPQIGKVKSTKLFSWDPVPDTITQKEESYVFKKINERTGKSIEELKREQKIRAALILKLSEHGLLDYKQVKEVINSYYVNPEAVMEKFGITDIDKNLKTQRKNQKKK